MEKLKLLKKQNRGYYLNDINGELKIKASDIVSVKFIFK